MAPDWGLCKSLITILPERAPPSDERGLPASPPTHTPRPAPPSLPPRRPGREHSAEPPRAPAFRCGRRHLAEGRRSSARLPPHLPPPRPPGTHRSLGSFPAGAAGPGGRRGRERGAVSSAELGGGGRARWRAIAIRWPLRGGASSLIGCRLRRGLRGVARRMAAGGRPLCVRRGLRRLLPSLGGGDEPGVFQTGPFITSPAPHLPPYRSLRAAPSRVAMPPRLHVVLQWPKL